MKRRTGSSISNFSGDEKLNGVTRRLSTVESVTYKQEKTFLFLSGAKEQSRSFAQEWRSLYQLSTS